MYQFDRGNSDEVEYKSSTIRVSKLYDQTLTGWDAFQTKLINQPKICSKEARIDNRYYPNFDGSERLISDINLNPNSGENDIANVFLVCK